MYKYRVEMEEGGAEKEVLGDQLFRKKSLYNKDKNRLYIKQFVHLSNNFWKLKVCYQILLLPNKRSNLIKFS